MLNQKHPANDADIGGINIDNRVNPVGRDRVTQHSERGVDILYWKKIAVIENINNSDVSSSITNGRRFFAEFSGASLLSLNELTRTESRLLSNYKKAWAERTKLAVELAGGINKLPLVGSVEIHLWRSGGKIVDNEGLPAAFKYLIDGLRMAGVFDHNSMVSATSMHMHQRLGGPAIAIEVIASEGETTDKPEWPTR